MNKTLEIEVKNYKTNHNKWCWRKIKRKGVDPNYFDPFMLDEFSSENKCTLQDFLLTHIEKKL